MSRILFLTFNDAPSGIYAGQVSGVCRFLEDELKHEVQLCAFLSLRGFSENSAKIKSSFHHAVTCRMVPRARNWRYNRFALRRVVRRFRPDTIIARGPFAANLALDLREQGKVKRVVFDGRGAYVAELHEYNVVPDEKVKNEIRALEKRSVLESDARIAVSEQLVHYWKKEFIYQSSSHEIIPCTLSEPVPAVPEYSKLKSARTSLNVADDETLLVYSGSTAGWQSLGETERFVQLLVSQPKLKILFLAQAIPGGDELKNKFGDRVMQRWVKPAEVAPLLLAADYGWLVREKSVTNRVASPVKFAEYLASGLDVIISPELGDYSELAEKKLPGSILLTEGKSIPVLSPKTIEEKIMLHRFAMEHFTKQVFREAYQRLCS